MSSQQTFWVRLVVRPKAGVRDPQADAVQEALHGLGHTGLQVCDVGRQMRLQVPAASREAALLVVDTICEQLLVNSHLETYAVEVDGSA